MFCFRWPTNTGCVRNWYHITHHSAAILFRHVQTTATWWRNAVLTCCRHCVVNTWVNQASNVQVRKNTMAAHIPQKSLTGRLRRRRDRPTINPISNWKGSKLDHRPCFRCISKCSTYGIYDSIAVDLMSHYVSVLRFTCQLCINTTHTRRACKLMALTVTRNMQTHSPLESQLLDDTHCHQRHQWP